MCNHVWDCDDAQLSIESSSADADMQACHLVCACIRYMHAHVEHVTSMHHGDQAASDGSKEYLFAKAAACLLCMDSHVMVVAWLNHHGP